MSIEPLRPSDNGRACLFLGIHGGQVETAVDFDDKMPDASLTSFRPIPLYVNSVSPALYKAQAMLCRCGGGILRLVIRIRVRYSVPPTAGGFSFLCVHDLQISRRTEYCLQIVTGGNPGLSSIHASPCGCAWSPDQVLRLVISDFCLTRHVERPEYEFGDPPRADASHGGKAMG